MLTCQRLPAPSLPYGDSLALIRTRPMRRRTSGSAPGSAANKILTCSSLPAQSAGTRCGASGQGDSRSQCPHSAAVTADPGAPARQHPAVGVRAAS